MSDFFPPELDAPFRLLLTAAMLLPVAIPVIWLGTIFIRDGIRNAKKRSVEDQQEAYRQGNDE